MYDELKSILVKDIGLAADHIRPDATLGEAGMDSLAMVELSLVLEKRHSITLTDDELIETATVAEISNLVAQRVSARLPQATG
ncbi:MAG TPA: acyl carrier protein [Jatrophihabitans sp.]|nr:acyl carrier protein [Jatrophihabitans sp.]